MDKTKDKWLVFTKQKQIKKRRRQGQGHNHVSVVAVEALVMVASELPSEVRHGVQLQVWWEQWEDWTQRQWHQHQEDSFPSTEESKSCCWIIRLRSRSPFLQQRSKSCCWIIRLRSTSPFPQQRSKSCCWIIRLRSTSPFLQQMKVSPVVE